MRILGAQQQGCRAMPQLELYDNERPDPVASMCGLRVTMWGLHALGVAKGCKVIDDFIGVGFFWKEADVGIQNKTRSVGARHERKFLKSKSVRGPKHRQHFRGCHLGYRIARDPLRGSLEVQSISASKRGEIILIWKCKKFGE